MRQEFSGQIIRSENRTLKFRKPRTASWITCELNAVYQAMSLCADLTLLTSTAPVAFIGNRTGL